MIILIFFFKNWSFINIYVFLILIAIGLAITWKLMKIKIKKIKINIKNFDQISDITIDKWRKLFVIFLNYYNNYYYYNV